ncbi:hypothetical protein MUK42_10670 [Musa troglodytarum]|uniref:Uncharacterized protein n=1 Tax=Musa troglodytarum TaxID=320322 RepID=A0A9E7JGU1_9LILI|nr:hypothetical protein MUK42_10670 [Musa troglodytarum]
MWIQCKYKYGKPEFVVTVSEDPIHSAQQPALSGAWAPSPSVRPQAILKVSLHSQSVVYISQGLYCYEGFGSRLCLFVDYHDPFSQEGEEWWDMEVFLLGFFCMFIDSIFSFLFGCVDYILIMEV